MVIDVSSAKDPDKQPQVAADVDHQIATSDYPIVGVMIESHLLGGRQDITPSQPLAYGQSITDGCPGWETSVAVLEELAAAVMQRRQARTVSD